MMKVIRQILIRLLQGLLLVPVFVLSSFVYADGPIEMEVGYEALEEYMTFELEEGYTYEVLNDDIAIINDGILIALRFGDTELIKIDQEGNEERIEIIVYLVGDEPVPWGSVEIKRSYITGYPDQTFRPKNFITRAEVATMFSKILDVKTADDIQILDVLNTHWAYSYIQNVLSLNLMSLKEEGEFYPEAYLTRSELADIICNYADYHGLYMNDEVKGMIADVPFSHESFISIHKVMNTKVMNLTNGAFSPEDFVNREQAVYIINKLVYDHNTNISDNKYLDVYKTNMYYFDILYATY